MAAAALAALRVFDGRMTADSAAPLTHTAWVDEFTRGTVGEKLGQERFKGPYGKRLFPSAVEGILARDDKGWCGEQGCDAASSAALGRALSRL